jgi:hypothetical protein
VARNVRSAQLETRTARLKLKLRKKPYMVRVAPGVRLGYRRNAVTGTWSVIAADGKSGNWIKKFGVADDHEEANGEEVLTFWQAQERARKLARGGKNADHDDDVGRPITVREALDAYQADLIARGGDVHNVTRVREHLSNTLNAKTVASRALLVKIKRDLENQIRGLLKNVGLVIGRAKFNGHLEKFLSASRHESDSVTARGYGRMERAGHGAEGLFRC